MSRFTARGNHSRVAPRLVNYHYKCKNPAFGLLKAQNSTVDKSYLEVPNAHSAIYYQHYNFPFPLANRKAIVNIVWKRVSEKTIVIAYHPLTSHSKVENKDGKSAIRGSFQVAILVTQLDDRLTEVEWGVHINFGGNLPKALVNAFVLPSTNRVLNHHQAFFADSLNLVNLSKDDGKLLGEIFV
ncbi:hypothetical protein TrLO_g11333 [Triparma laevis f. longispina]|uniref:START domain-containing protein n=1 Tax=Triparma laevis f. longispina TaxID=1714387 RepID=A0A9W7C110_9STRA|nr:hypothetical protein TrLO_g11333 [Triparma laevis f. longispina]